MQSRWKEIRAAGGEVLAVSADSIEQTRKAFGPERFSFPILGDPGLQAIDAYGLRHPGGGFEGDIARSAIFLIDEEGQVVWRHLTDNWRIRPRPESVLRRVQQLD